ncbi:50S ribosomal protein L4 [Candidatus Curtissbacteria bacterium]|nr:50S ribosomal protein L4 [Candidatus Curtissbacteria bacterium]
MSNKKQKRSKIAKTRIKTGSKTIDKKKITEGTENKLKAQKRTAKKSAPSNISVPSVITKQSGPSKLAIKSVSAKVFNMQGRGLGVVALPKAIFGHLPNQNLLAQAIRVYVANSHPHTAHTKTRAEVAGGGTKPWRQKGTGRARAGSIRSPLWVGGGTTFGPRTKDTKLSLPKKMKHKALIDALSAKAKAGDIKVISNIEKVEPKTKKIATLLKKLDVGKNTLLIVSERTKNVHLATRNIPNIKVDIPSNLNAYEVTKNNDLLISKESLPKFK